MKKLLISLLFMMLLIIGSLGFVSNDGLANDPGDPGMGTVMLLSDPGDPGMG